MGGQISGSFNTGQFQATLEHSNTRPHHSTFQIEGLLRPHYFPLKKITTNYLCEPSCSFARIKDFATGEKEEYVSVGLISSEDGKNHRDDLNLVIVLDVSGSMDCGFTTMWPNYVTTEGGRVPNQASKLNVAKNCLKKILGQMKQNERIGIVLFSDTSIILQPIRKVSDIDLETLLKKIDKIATIGGTNLDCGIKTGIQMLKDLIQEDQEISQKNAQNVPKNNRMILLTDAIPNVGGEFDEMFNSTSEAASKKYQIFTTFIGVGIDFGSDLVTKLTRIRGANYFTVDTEESFEKLMIEDFNYMVTPIAFNVNLCLESNNYEIEASYGSQYDSNEFTNNSNSNSNFFLKIDTICASDIDSKKGVKGGIIVLKLKKKLSSNPIDSDNSINITISYDNPNGKQFQHSNSINIEKNQERIEEANELEQEDDEEFFYEDLAVRKAILLTKYFCFVKKLLIDFGPKNEEDRKTNAIDYEQWQAAFGDKDKPLPEEKRNQVKEFQKWFKHQIDQWFQQDKELIVQLDNLDRLKFT